MRTKAQYEAMVRFQQKYKDDPEFIHKQLEKFCEAMGRVYSRNFNYKLVMYY